MSKLLYYTIATTIVSLLVPSALVQAGEITLYTHRHYEADGELFAAFTKIGQSKSIPAVSSNRVYIFWKKAPAR